MSPQRVQRRSSSSRRFDLVLIHGDPKLIGFDRSFAGWDAIRDRARLYRLCRGRAIARRRATDGRDEVIVSVGGGAVGAPLLRPRPRGARRRRRWPTGPGGCWSAPICRPRRVDGDGRHDRRAGARRLPRLAAQRDAVDLAGRLQHRRRDAVLRRSRRAGAVRHGARDRADRSRAAGSPSAASSTCVPAEALSADTLAAAVDRALRGPLDPQLPALRPQRRGATTAALLQQRLRMSTLGRALDEELARWRDAGREPTLWWRDDDAVDATPALDRLLDAAAHATAVPLALAVVPAQRDAGAGRAPRASTGRRRAAARLRPHQPCARRREEDGARPAPAGDGRAGRARHRLDGAGAAVRPARAAGAGAALEPHRARRWCRPCRRSAFAACRPSASAARADPVSGLLQVNTHVDLIDWQGAPLRRRRGGARRAVRAGARARRAPDTDEPVGILSHHLAMDEAAWDFLRSLLGRVRACRA